MLSVLSRSAIAFTLLALLLATWILIAPHPHPSRSNMGSDSRIENPPSLPGGGTAMTDDTSSQSITDNEDAGKISLSEAEWREKLTPEQYQILRERGTERAYTGKHWNSKAIGVYHCAGCGQALFASDTKFDSGCGWPSYFQPIDNKVVTEKEDRSSSMVRTEILCTRCGGHLGHVFKDGPAPTGLRYCINSAAMTFTKLDKNNTKTK